MLLELAHATPLGRKRSLSATTVLFFKRRARPAERRPGLVHEIDVGEEVLELGVVPTRQLAEQQLVQPDIDLGIITEISSFFYCKFNST